MFYADCDKWSGGEENTLIYTHVAIEAYGISFGNKLLFASGLVL